MSANLLPDLIPTYRSAAAVGPYAKTVVAVDSAVMSQMGMMNPFILERGLKVIVVGRWLESRKVLSMAGCVKNKVLAIYHFSRSLLGKSPSQ